MDFNKNNLLFIFFPLFLALFYTLLFSMIYACSSSLPIQREDPFNRVSLSIVGDLMAHTKQIEAAKLENNLYDFQPQFREIAPFLKQNDITIGNLETTISDLEHGYYGFPLFRTPENYIKTLKESGFDLITTANNHSYDGGSFGIIHTIKTLNKYSIAQTGTNIDLTQRETPLIIEKNGIKIAVFAYTHSLNGNEWKILKDNRKWRITSIYNKEVIKNQFLKAKTDGADIILASVHWGNEYQRAPDKYQKRDAKMLGEYGADIIAGSHPHVLQPVEWIDVKYKGENKKVLTAWSLGNILAHMGNSWHKHSDTAIIWNIEISKEKLTGVIKIESTNYMPTWIYIFKENKTLDFRILPLYSNFDRIKELNYPFSTDDKKRYKEAWLETKELLDKKWFIPFENKPL